MSTDTPCSSSMSWLDPNDISQHGRIVQHYGRWTQRGNAALAPDCNAIGKALYHFHVVLDEHCCYAGPAQDPDQRLDDLELLGGGNAAGGLVHQQQAWLERHG